jgi:hypothetical protein
VTLTVILVGIATSLIASIIYATVGGGYRRWFGQQIAITDPVPHGFLTAAEMRPGVMKHVVSGTLKYLPKDHEIWLLVEDEFTGKAWPQGHAPVEYNKDKGTWKGFVNVMGWHSVIVVAVVAPPTSQDYFNYFQRMGRDFKTGYQPIGRIPPECKRRATVHAKVSPAPQTNA